MVVICMSENRRLWRIQKRNQRSPSGFDLSMICLEFAHLCVCLCWVYRRIGVRVCSCCLSISKRAKAVITCVPKFRSVIPEGLSLLHQLLNEGSHVDWAHRWAGRCRIATAGLGSAAVNKLSGAWDSVLRWEWVLSYSIVQTEHIWLPIVESQNSCPPARV